MTKNKSQYCLRPPSTGPSCCPCPSAHSSNGKNPSWPSRTATNPPIMLLWCARLIIPESFPYVHNPFVFIPCLMVFIPERHLVAYLQTGRIQNRLFRLYRLHRRIIRLRKQSGSGKKHEKNKKKFQSIHFQDSFYPKTRISRFGPGVFLPQQV